MTRTSRIARSAHPFLAAAPLALAIIAAGAHAAESGRCIAPASLPPVPAAVAIGKDAGENVAALRRSLGEWQSYRLQLLDRLEKECATARPALSTGADCEIAPLEDAWDDFQLTGNDVEDSMHIAAELRYIKLSAADLRSRFVLCREPGKAGG